MMQQTKQHKVCVLIPSYNAGGTLAPVIEEIKGYYPDIIVIDDGSTDNTAQVARDSGVTLLQHPANRGKGAALCTGFDYAKKNGFTAAITMDADGQTMAVEAPRLLEAFCRADGGGCEIVIGSRRHEMKGMRLGRRIANAISSWLISTVCRQPIDDSQSGYRVIGVNLWQDCGICGTRYEAETEFLIKASRKGARIKCVPVQTSFIDGVPTSHFCPTKDALRILRVIFSNYGRSGSHPRK